MGAYEGIVGELRAAVLAGELRPGERLPARARLAERFGQSVPVVEEALRVLQDEGLVEQRDAGGDFVRATRTPAIRTNLRHQWEKDRARGPEEERAQTGITEHDTGLQVDDLVFHASYQDIEADEELSDVFDVPQGTAVLERTYRTRYAAEHAPFTLVTSHLVRAVVAPNPELLDSANEPWPGGTQSQLWTVGVELDRIEEHVTTRPARPEEAEELDLAPGRPVIVLLKTSFDTDGRVVEFSRVILPGDRTELTFSTPLERW